MEMFIVQSRGIWGARKTKIAAMFLVLALSLFITGPASAVVNDDELVGYYSFNNCTAADDSGTGNNGTIVGGAQCDQGINGTALTFGGYYDHGYVRIPNSPTLSFLDNYTFTLWFNIQSYTSMDGWGSVSEYGMHSIFAKAGDRNGLLVRTVRDANNGLLRLLTHNGRFPFSDQFGMVTSQGFDLDEWHMVTVTSGGGEVNVYFDCELQNSVPTGQFNVNTSMQNMPLQLGVDQGAWWYPINGILDEARVYRRALSEDEVKELYKAVGFENCPGENLPPTAAAGLDQTIECSGPDGTLVTLDGSGSSDPEGDALTYSWTWDGGSAEGVNPTVTLPLGTSTITLTVSDGEYEDTDEVTITIGDTTPPSTSAILEGELGNNGWYVSDVTVTLTSTDGCSGVKEVRYTLDGTAAVVNGDQAVFTISTDGIHGLSFNAVDNAGNVEQEKTFEVKIDRTAPVVDISVTPGLLWPPNRKMVDVAVSGGSNDPSSGVASVEFTVTDEYGTVEPVISGFNTTIPLEAWRNGGDRDGRHYTITAVITDNAGNVTTVTTEAVCPHDMREKK